MTRNIQITRIRFCCLLGIASAIVFAAGFFSSMWIARIIASSLWSPQ